MVTADRAIGDEWLITAGLAAGDRVIVDGLQKARPGSPVKPCRRPKRWRAIAGAAGAPKRAAGASRSANDGRLRCSRDSSSTARSSRG